MWKKTKALVEPLERLMTTLGTKGPKSSTTHSGQITCFTKQQASEIQKQVITNNFTNTNKVLEQAGLRNFLFENFSIFKAFSPQPAPIPIVFSQTPLRVCKPQGLGVLSQHALLRPAGTRDIISRGFRNFSTIQPAMLNNGTNSGSAVLSHLGFKPFSAFASKSGSLWFRKENVLNDNKFDGIKKQQKLEEKGEKMRGRFSIQNNNKGIFEIVRSSNIIEDNKNKPRIVRSSSIKEQSNENEVVEKIPEVFINDNENVQVYMSIILSSSVFWNLDDSMSSSANSVNSTSSVLSYLLQRRNNSVPQRPNSQLNSSFIQHLQEIAEMQHDHMMEVISVLGALLRRGDFEVIINGCELRVNFPRGMQKIEIENMLQTLDIDPNNPHFELEEILFDESIELSPPADENNEGIYMQLPEPNNSYFDNEFTVTTPSSPGYEFVSYSSSNGSPVLLPSRDSVDYISGCSSPYNSPPRLGAEYITGIQEFLNAVDEALVKNTSMFNSRDDEIGEDYYEN